MRRVVLLVLVGTGFVSLGLPDGMLGVAWPGMHRQFGVPLDAIGQMLVVFTAGYLASSFGSGALLLRMRLGSLIGASACLSAASLLAFAWAGHWAWIVVFSAFAGLGAGAVDSGLNAYAALRHGPGALSWFHAAYGIGAAVSPMALGQWLAAGGTWRAGYLAVGGVEVAMALAFIATRGWWPATSEVSTPGVAASAADRPSLWDSLRRGPVWLGIGTFLVYTGLEAAIGMWAYTLLTEKHGLGAGPAGGWISAYWGALAAGRIVSGVLASRVGSAAILRTSAGFLLLGTGLAVVGPGAATCCAGIVVAGLACAPMFPLLIALTPARVGTTHTPGAVGFQMAAAALGMAFIPWAIGIAAEARGVGVIPALWFFGALVVVGMVFKSLRSAPPKP